MKQQQGWQIVKTPQQQSPQIINFQQTWLPRRQQEQTIKRQFQKLQTHKDLHYALYRDRKQFKKNKKTMFCLFHGTTNDQFESFIKEQILWDFYLTPDLETAIWYAKQRKDKFKHDPQIQPAIFVFKFQNKSTFEEILRRMTIVDQSYGYFKITTDEDYTFLIKNSLVEMITLKQQQSKQQSKQKK